MAPTTLLIAGPATMAGGFQIRVSEGGAWLATSSLLLFFAAACQVRFVRPIISQLRNATANLSCVALAQGIGLVFFYYKITATAKKHEEELKVRRSCCCRARISHAQFVLNTLPTGQAQRSRGGGAAGNLREDGGTDPQGAR
jgi:hypothetical protein